MITLYLHIAFFSIGFIVFIVFKKYLKTRKDIKHYNSIPLFMFWALLCIYSIYTDIKNYNNHNKFINTAIHSKIIDSYEWKSNQFEYTLQNKLIMSGTSGGFGLHIDDSIVKGANTPIFEVYRKDYNGVIVLYKKFNYDNDSIYYQSH